MKSFSISNAWADIWFNPFFSIQQNRGKKSGAQCCQIEKSVVPSMTVMPRVGPLFPILLSERNIVAYRLYSVLSKITLAGLPDKGYIVIRAFCWETRISIVYRDFKGAPFTISVDKKPTHQPFSQSGLLPHKKAAITSGV